MMRASPSVAQGAALLLHVRACGCRRMRGHAGGGTSAVSPHTTFTRLGAANSAQRREFLADCFAIRQNSNPAACRQANTTAQRAKTDIHKQSYTAGVRTSASRCAQRGDVCGLPSKSPCGPSLSGRRATKQAPQGKVHARPPPPAQTGACTDHRKTQSNTPCYHKLNATTV